MLHALEADRALERRGQGGLATPLVGVLLDHHLLLTAVPVRAALHRIQVGALEGDPLLALAPDLHAVPLLGRIITDDVADGAVELPLVCEASDHHGPAVGQPIGGSSLHLCIAGFLVFGWAGL